MAADMDHIAIFTGPVGFEAYAGHMSREQGHTLKHELHQIPGVERVSESPKTNKYNGLMFRVFVLSTFDTQTVRRNVADKVAELVQKWGVSPMPTTTRF